MWGVSTSLALRIISGFAQSVSLPLRTSEDWDKPSAVLDSRIKGVREPRGVPSKQESLLLSIFSRLSVP